MHIEWFRCFKVVLVLNMGTVTQHVGVSFVLSNHLPICDVNSCRLAKKARDNLSTCICIYNAENAKGIDARVHDMYSSNLFRRKGVQNIAATLFRQHASLYWRGHAAPLP